MMWPVRWLAYTAIGAYTVLAITVYACLVIAAQTDHHESQP